MAKLYFRHGAMGSSKTANALMVEYNYYERGKKALLLKPQLDNRDGEKVIKSRMGLEKECRFVEELVQMRDDEIRQYDCVIVDEAQFCKKSEIELFVHIVDDLSIPVICYGLRTDFRREPFEGSIWLLAWADVIPEAETEPETETERETETETEEETEPPLVLSGNIEGKVVLDGLFPPLCRGNLDLSGLFQSGRPGRLSYMAYTQTEGIADCRLDGAVLSLTGRSNGMTKVIVRAETEDGYTLETEFYIQIKALFSSLWYLAVIPAAAAGVILLIILVRRASDTDYSKAELFGSLCWYVKGEGEKIYGVPSNQTTDLSEYGSRATLADFAEDELLEGAELKKVIFTAGKDYVRVRCRGRSCRLYSEESGICDRLELEDGCSFRILCEGDEGKAAVICLYSSDAENEMDTEEEDEGERTRLLI